MRRLPRFLLPIALVIVLSLGASAQDAPIYKRGYTVTENTMPPSPKPASVTSPAGLSTGYEYDPGARLSKEIKGGVTSNYAYDARGNLSSESGAEGSRTYSYVGDRLASLVRSAGGTSTFSHDEHGKMTLWSRLIYHINNYRQKNKNEE